MSSSEVAFGGIDVALLGLFFISYSAFALTQINFLFNGHYGRFCVFLMVQLLAVASIKFSSFAEFCSNDASALICNNGAQGLMTLASMWILVSLTMICFFALSRYLTRMKSRRRVR